MTATEISCAETSKTHYTFGLYLCSANYLYIFEIGSHCVTTVNLKLMILSYLLPESGLIMLSQLPLSFCGKNCLKWERYLQYSFVKRSTQKHTTHKLCFVHRLSDEEFFTYRTQYRPILRKSMA